MSGLSLSSSEDDEPIIVGTRNRKKKRLEQKRDTNSPFRKKKDDKATFDFENGSPQESNKKSKAHQITPDKDNRFSLRLTSPSLVTGGKGG